MSPLTRALISYTNPVIQPSFGSFLTTLFDSKDTRAKTIVCYSEDWDHAMAPIQCFVICAATRYSVGNLEPMY